jgi:hypothetical protein
MLFLGRRALASFTFLIAVPANASPAGVFEDRRLTMILSPSNEEQGSGASPSSSADAGLTERLAQAEAVVSGVVLEVSPFQAQAPAFLTHHNPDWWKATIQVDTVEKGTVSAKTIDVLYANSSDIAWSKSPKLAKGEHGVWLLQNKDPFGKATPALAVVDAVDRHALTDLTKVRALLKNSSPKK